MTDFVRGYRDMEIEVMRRILVDGPNKIPWRSLFLGTIYARRYLPKELKVGGEYKKGQVAFLRKCIKETGIKI